MVWCVYPQHWGDPLMPSMEHDRQWRRILRAYHDAVVYVPGLERFDRDGNPIKPLGTKEAARIASLNPSDLRNRLNINIPEQRPTLEGFVMHLLSDMNTAPLDELERGIGRVAIRVPDVEGHEDVQRELAMAIREFGDVGRVICESLDKDSAGGRSITKRELATIHVEVDEAVGALYELLAAIEAEAK